MEGTLDKAKGRIKEAAGALTDDKSLKREGKVDQIVGGVKNAVETAVDTVKDVAEAVVEKVDDAVHHKGIKR